MNNNKNDENALLAGCKGVFAKTSYITIGNKDKPESYGARAALRPNFKGKQFQTAPPKEGGTNDVYFEKKHNWISDGDKYYQGVRYKELQPDKKKGFQTSDYSKRDEFSNTIRTEQWREQLTQEGKFAKQALELFSQSAGVLATSQHTMMSQPQEEQFLYDLVFEKDEPGFSGASKTHRDTKNRTHITHDRTLGSMLTTSSITFQAPEDFEKPHFARKPIVRDTFYRKTNIFFPKGTAATNGQE